MLRLLQDRRYNLGSSGFGVVVHPNSGTRIASNDIRNVIVLDTQANTEVLAFPNGHHNASLECFTRYAKS